MDTVQASFDCSDLENPMGEGKKDALRVNFDKKLKLAEANLPQIYYKRASFLPKS